MQKKFNKTQDNLEYRYRGLTIPDIIYYKGAMKWNRESRERHMHMPINVSWATSAPCICLSKSCSRKELGNLRSPGQIQPANTVRLLCLSFVCDCFPYNSRVEQFWQSLCVTTCSTKWNIYTTWPFTDKWMPTSTLEGCASNVVLGKANTYTMVLARNNTQTNRDFCLPYCSQFYRIDRTQLSSSTSASKEL